MARQYPRFLFSNPQNTKSKGPFIVHTLYPKMIFKVVQEPGQMFPMRLEYLEVWDECDDNKKSDVYYDAMRWYQSQLREVIRTKTAKLVDGPLRGKLVEMYLEQTLYKTFVAKQNNNPRFSDLPELDIEEINYIEKPYGSGLFYVQK